MSLDLSVAMLVRDPPIERLVTLISYMSHLASQFVIVDTGSQPEDIRAMAAMNQAPWGLPAVLVLQREWRNDFAWARNEGLDRVNRKWTLILDPDELPSIPMMKHIEEVVDAERTPTLGTVEDSALGYLYFTHDYFGGLRDPEAEYQWHVRLFRTGHGRFYRPLDELVALDGLPESETRSTPRLPKAPKSAYLIHSKDSDAVEQSKRLYRDMARKSNGVSS